MAKLSLKEMEQKLQDAKGTLTELKVEFSKDNRVTVDEQATIFLIESQIALLEKKILERKADSSISNFSFSKKEVDGYDDKIDKYIEFTKKTQDKAEQLNDVYNSYVKIKLEMQKFADASMALGENEKSDKYKLMVEHLSSISSSVHKMKESMDKLAGIEESKITESLSKASNILDKVSVALNVFDVLFDDKATKKFIANPDSFDAAEVWGEHMIKCFNTIADTTEKIPSAEPLTSLVTIFAGTARAGAGLISQFMASVKIKLKQIETESGGHVNILGRHRHYINQMEDGKPLYEGAFIHLFLAVYNNPNYPELLKILKEERDKITDYSQSAETRLKFVINQLIAKKLNNLKLYFDLIEQHRDNIKKLAKTEAARLYE